MARRVFFSFHYQRDIWRVNVVRNSWLTQDREVAGYFDASLWEKAKKNGDAAIKKMIDDALVKTSVTVVLIGAESDGRKYIDYEITQSHKKKNGMLAIYIHSIKNKDGYTDTKGTNPFDRWYIPNSDGSKTYFSSMYKTYDWKLNDGYNNLGTWVEEAAKDAGR